ncbi:type I-C CRISPR-associated protein Cas5c [Moorella sulfitireducens]|uniref:type I-C CRISPR-associated protein Cas5c n=1 Tax=Neomoorella sulfitireducens TaxID=2972948 RepID=UPI0021AC950C|nr:type I-C CRISPR-associated protein Cas5c [Moorella sulfitireducens]
MVFLTGAGLNNPARIEGWLAVKVWGDLACFTRPEMKVERVSYPVMTPSAARGILEAIFWKPEFYWRVRQIEVLKPIRYFSILRNEVNNKMVVSTAQGWAKNGGGYYADQDRAQRHTLALREVAYVIRAEQVPAPHAGDIHPAKYRDQFRRRVERGQCYHRPYLGCREFSAFFGPASANDKPVSHTENLGRMLLDLKYNTGGSGTGKPVFFEARLDNGILRVPQELYEEIGR